MISSRFPVLHGEVGDVGVGGDLELEDPLGGGGAPVEHRAEDRGEGVAGHDGGLDGQLLDQRLGLLQRPRRPTSPTGGNPQRSQNAHGFAPARARTRRFNLRHGQNGPFKSTQTVILHVLVIAASQSFDLTPRGYVRACVRVSDFTLAKMVFT